MHLQTFLRHARPSRTAVAVSATALALVAVSACGSDSSSTSAAAGSGDTTDFKVVLPWYADAEGGGFFAAKAEGLYEDQKLDVTLQSGGPQVSATQLVAAGRAQVGFADAAGIVQAQQQGIPIVAIGALYQDNPVGVMTHKDSGITSFDDMDGKTWVTQTGQLGPAWVKKKTGIDFSTQVYQGSIANFLKKDSLVQQGWPTNEAYQAQKAGVEVDFIPFSDSGYNPYNDVFFTSESYLKSHREELTAFLAASMQGWQDYMGDVSVAKTANAAILKANDQQTSGSVWYAWDKQRKYVVAGDGKKQLGTMTADRWNTLIDQMKQLGQLKGTPKAADLYDSSLLPKVAAPSALPAAPDGSY
ncbi:ABC transporter substrate-binding protein [Streptomyces sp. BH-SS-21]|uniref:Thiamine pyrimidine synthase n=1 Tax=Streptomyces liliiviolaceus TaxID=2823109 RepID=A0A941B3J4_9ACTN|nr:ABC transporter substrate-binding protein [Streptomyces liliiviolaceus]MBQ0849295.1 ABC transporter substrate-binding protein [Streptomyces liliiviolaceus]